VTARPHAGRVSSPPTARPGAVPGLPRSVLAVGACFLLGAAAATAMVAYPGQQPASSVLLLPWPVFGVAAGILMDQNRFPALARVFTALSLVPFVLLVPAALPAGVSLPTPAELIPVVRSTAGLLAAAVLIGVPVAIRSTARSPWPAAGVSAGLVGSVVIAVAHRRPGVADIGWLLVAAGCVVVWAEVARGARTAERMRRRRAGWLLVTLGVASAVTLAGWSLLPDDVACYVTATCLALVAITVTRLCLVEEFRPLDENLLDLGLLVAAVAAATGVGLAVRLGAGWAGMPAPGTPAALAAGLTAATAAPAALWLRRSVLARRYGHGAISPADVAVITADLRVAADPRELLDKAARMVATASGCREARLVLGEDVPEVPDGWVVHLLDVGGERVGSLAVRSAGDEGPEPRQDEVITRLLPTVALVARAVTLAVEAELARRDVARQRDLERRRILADLHDGLGPVLAGMSMRVRAALRANGSGAEPALLADLADGLAASRTDLRRIVAGITPSALEGGDLAAALERLVASFRDHEAGGPTLALDVALTAPVPSSLQVAVYRCVAEGVTNALRHAGASTITVRVASRDGLVTVDVVDDGAGGRIVPGVGLSSLRARADGLGGRLDVSPGEPRGTRVQLEIPCAAGSPA